MTSLVMTSLVSDDYISDDFTTIAIRARNGLIQGYRGALAGQSRRGLKEAEPADYISDGRLVVITKKRNEGRRACSLIQSYRSKFEAKARVYF